MAMTSPRTDKEELRLSCDPRLSSELLGYTVSIEKIDTPDDVLDRLHAITWQCCRLSVLGAALLPLKWGDLSGVEKGKTVFLHKSAPEGWWNEHIELSRMHPGPGSMFAQLALAPFTMSETMRRVEPLGIDRWPFELALKYGMRDRLNCPVGGRWVVTYWSRHVLTSILSQQARALLFMGATFAAIRIQHLIGSHARRVGKGVSLTPRELAVLRSLSIGNHIKETALHLELGEETVRSHLKKAQAKLGVHDRTHAVAEAMRQHLIP
jgi:LuxR family quorum sensing-dependent transcriptional regulator